MSYFDNFNNGLLNKYKKFKNKKEIIDIFFTYRLIVIQISLSFDSLSKIIKFLCNCQQFQFNIF
jgi:hypothetical protein